MTSEDAFDALGLKLGASPKRIQEAYRKLAMAAHPDRGGDSEVFAGINAAYVEAMRYADTENCPVCTGLGRTLVSGHEWSSVYVSCRICGGSGKRH